MNYIFDDMRVLQGAVVLAVTDATVTIVDDNGEVVFEDALKRGVRDVGVWSSFVPIGGTLELTNVLFPFERPEVGERRAKSMRLHPLSTGANADFIPRGPDPMRYEMRQLAQKLAEVQGRVSRGEARRQAQLDRREQDEVQPVEVIENDPPAPPEPVVVEGGEQDVS